MESGVTGEVIQRLIFVISLFVCVLLHELGHALCARLFGIGTREIMLYPFGGVAYLERDGAPKEEFFVSLAGPVVNVVIAILIGVSTTLGQSAQWDFDANYWGLLLYANLFLALFNLIPAYPMDGGRIFRALLAWGGVTRATVYATRLSQVISVCMGVYAVFNNNIILVIISVMIFTHAVQELMRERTRGAARGVRVSEIMTDREMLQTFTHGTTITGALQLALKSLQPAFPVLHGDTVIGIIDRDALIQAAALDADEQYVASVMNRTFPTIDKAADITIALDGEISESGGVIVVLSDGAFAGLLFKDKILEFLVIQDVRRKTKDIAQKFDEQW
jgi:Zn-dependent protease/predicted transcriptional regulator